MSLFRTLLAAAAALAIASPVFAADDATTGNATQPEATAPAAQTDNTQAAAPAGTEAKININSATAKELMKVKGLNASKARAIVNYRKKHGNFKTLDDLAKVKGFNKLHGDNLKNIQDQLDI